MIKRWRCFWTTGLRLEGNINMKIAVTTNGNTLEDVVTGEYEKSTHLLVVETDDLSFRCFEKVTGDERGIMMAELINQHECEAVITGTIEEPAFEVLAGYQITRYVGTGYSAREALTKMDLNELDYTTEFKGGEGRPHNHGAGICDGTCAGSSEEN